MRCGAVSLLCKEHCWNDQVPQERIPGVDLAFGFEFRHVGF